MCVCILLSLSLSLRYGIASDLQRCVTMGAAAAASPFTAVQLLQVRYDLFIYDAFIGLYD